MATDTTTGIPPATEEPEAELKRLRSLIPEHVDGDVKAQARAWAAVYRTAEACGMLSAPIFVPTGMERVCEFIRTLAAERARADRLEKERDASNEEVERLWGLISAEAQKAHDYDQLQSNVPPPPEESRP